MILAEVTTCRETLFWSLLFLWSQQQKKVLLLEYAQHKQGHFPSLSVFLLVSLLSHIYYCFWGTSMQLVDVENHQSLVLLQAMLRSAVSRAILVEWTYQSLLKSSQVVAATIEKIALLSLSEWLAKWDRTSDKPSRKSLRTASQIHSCQYGWIVWLDCCSVDVQPILCQNETWKSFAKRLKLCFWSCHFLCIAVNLSKTRCCKLLTAVDQFWPSLYASAVE